MIENTVFYSNYVQYNVKKKIENFNQEIERMLIRLEEFESMLTIVQQEQLNAVGSNRIISDASAYQKELHNLTTRIDVLDTLIQHAEVNVNALETHVETAEVQFGLLDTSTKLKTFFLPLFKKKVDRFNIPSEETEQFTADMYFKTIID